MAGNRDTILSEIARILRAVLEKVSAPGGGGGGSVSITSPLGTQAAATSVSTSLSNEDKVLLTDIKTLLQSPFLQDPYSTWENTIGKSVVYVKWASVDVLDNPTGASNLKYIEYYTGATLVLRKYFRYDGANDVIEVKAI